MPTQVLYRKWRPQRLAEVAGQEPITHTLRQAVALGRVAHAYLFCGPRGTGKTSTARILAKAANCQNPRNGEPDNTCPICSSINEGRAMDLIEMDAASNRGIDDIRNIRERVYRMPAEARYKVYIIDEAHMLTGEAFNAFLKTLEEPPPHAIFILCTTEPHRLPPTIISRCQRFDFRRIPQQAVVERLATICQGEGFQVEAPALRAIARAAQGSLRDAANLLEQLTISYGPRIGQEQVQQLLGEEANQEAVEFVRHALSQEVGQGIQMLNRVATSGADLRAFHRQVVECLRAVLLLKSGMTAESLDVPPDALEGLREVSSRVSWEGLLKAVKLFGGINFRMDTPTTLPLELALVESAMAERPGATAPSFTRSEERTPRSSVPQGMIPGPPSRSPEKVSAVRPPPNDAHTSSVAAAGGPTSAPQGQRAALPEAQWETLCKLLKRVKGKRYVLGSLLLDCQGHYLEGDTLYLAFRSQANRDRFQEELEHPPSRQALGDAVKKALGDDYKLQLGSAEGNASGQRSQGHLVRAAMAIGARIVEEKGEKDEP